jgi:hypothetical protein
LCDLNNVVIFSIGFPFPNFFSKYPKSGVGANLVIYKGILGENSEFWGAKCGRPATLLGRPVCPHAQFDSVFSCCILPVENSTFICVEQ